MAFDITAEVAGKFEQCRKSLHMVESIKSAFCDSPPGVNAEPYQYMLETSVSDLLEAFDALCLAFGFPN